MPNASRSPGWYAIRWQVLERDNFTCQYCGQRAPEVMLHVDHIVAKVNGGENENGNLITACSACNVGKSIVPFLSAKKRTRSAKAGNTLGWSDAIIQSLLINGPSTATELSRELKYCRSNISTFLSQDGRFEKTKQIGRNVYYGVKH